MALGGKQTRLGGELPAQPSNAAQGHRWWEDKWSWQVTAVFCACGVAFPAAVGLITAWLLGQL